MDMHEIHGEKMDELQDMYEEMMELYNSLKREIRQKDKHMYEQWKAGGFLVDPDIVSMYPCLGIVLEDMQEEVCDEKDIEN